MRRLAGIAVTIAKSRPARLKTGVRGLIPFVGGCGGQHPLQSNAPKAYFDD